MGLLSLLKSISIGSFTNKKEYENHPFWELRDNELLLKQHFKILTESLAFNVDKEIVQLFQTACYYFMQNPSKYDGASGDVELFKIDKFRYDRAAIIHDYLDAINFTYTFQNLRLADKVFAKIMKDIGVPAIHYNKRIGLLLLIAPLRFSLSRKRRNNLAIPTHDLKVMLENYVKDFRVDYRQFFTYLMAGIALIIVCATHPWVMKVYKFLF
jgi:hypothetical protein